MEENFHFICILNHVSAGDDVSVISLLTDDKARSIPRNGISEVASSARRLPDRRNGGRLLKRYRVTITAKDDNYGRSAKPNGTYTDTMQRRRAAERGVALDRGCEFVAALANRTYVIR